tara:strand:- start:7708 stop:9192 length:1485 start_codon:yes stop_codon:yes gene_type:complete
MSLPDILKVAPQGTVDTMEVHTSILEPLVCNQNNARFQLERRGILDINSCIQVARVKEPATGSLATEVVNAPIRAGCHAWIKSASLRVGAQTIATTDEYGKYQTLNRQFKSVEERCRKDGVLKGTVDGMEPSWLANGQLQPMNLEWGNNDNGAPRFSGETSPEIEITADQATTPVFSIKLSELFPMMRGVQLPLYLMAENLVIDIIWQSSSYGLSFYSSDRSLGAGNFVENCPIATTQIAFLADYLSYNDSKMGDMAAQSMSTEGLTLPYNDIILTTAAINAAQAGAVPAGSPPVRQTVNRDIGLSSRSVQKIQWADIPNTTGEFGAEWFLIHGFYVSRGFAGGSEWNMKINDRLVFNRPVRNEAQQQYYLSQTADGVDLQVASCEYSFDQTVNDLGKVIKPAFGVDSVDGPLGSINSNALTDLSMTGLCHYQGLDLTNPMSGAGVTVGVKPIILERTLFRGEDDYANQAMTTYIWAQVGRLFVLNNGTVQITE